MHAIGIGPTLALRAGGVRVPFVPPVFDFAGGALPAGASVARSSAATCYNAAGFAAVIAADTPRFDYDPTTLAYRGLLIEPAATNLFQRSDAIDNAYWIAGSAISRAANVSTSPISASATADRVTRTIGGGTSYLRCEASLVAATYTLSLFIKAESARYLGVKIVGASGSLGNAVFDMAAPGFVMSPADYVLGFQALPGGWFRIWATRAYPAGEASGTGYFGIALTDAGGNESWATPSAVSALVTGLQLETGAVPTSHIATTNAPATRSADAVTLDWASRGVSDGPITVRYRFDDGSTQDVATSVTAGKSVVPTGLNRRWITRAALV